MICWTAIYLLPLAAFIFLAASGYIKAPADQIPFWIKLLAPMRLVSVSFFVCLGIAWTAKISRRQKIRWSIISLVAGFLQMAALSAVMTIWFLAHVPNG